MKLDKYTCEGQMSIFDFLQSEKPKQSIIEKPNIPSLEMPFPCRECKFCDDLVCKNNRKPEEHGECELFCSRTPYFDTMSIEEAADQIGKECGLDFNKGFCYSEENENAIEYTAKYKKLTISIHFSHFDGAYNSSRFLALDVSNDKAEGFGSPCLSVEEVIREIKRNIDRLIICKYSQHTCNKANLWEVADTLDDIKCPHTCCRGCDIPNCGARCNGSEEPKRQQDTTDEYLKENPTCFYVFGHYLDRADGWHKVPEELPMFTPWQKVDVVVFGKKTGTAWMELGAWEAKDWTFRTIDEAKYSESIEVLAWKLSD